MAIKNYTSGVDVYASLGEIQGALAGHGARQIMVEYDEKGRPTGVTFSYVPAEARTEDNDWYGKGMVLSSEQIEGLVRFLTKAKPYEWQEAIQLVKEAVEAGDRVVVNADW